MIPSRGRPLNSLQKSLRPPPISSRQFSSRPFRIQNAAQWRQQPHRPNLAPAYTASSILLSSIGSSRSLSLWGWGSSSKPPSTTPFTSESAAQPVTPASPDSKVLAPSSQPSESAALPADPVPASIEPPSISAPFEIDNPLDKVDYASIPEHIGYLKELGIDFGWGPTSCVQWLLEHVHVYSGFPWWGSIFTTALILRLTVFPLFLKSSREISKMQAIKPEMTRIMAQIKKAQAEGDHAAQSQGIMNMRQLNRFAGVKPFYMYLPMIINMPLAFGAFRLCRAAADLPVPGWETGGLWWLSDLTAPDPYYITPLVFAATMHIFTRLGGDSGAALDQSPMIKPLLFYILPAGMAIGLCWLPLALHFSFLASLVLGIAQSSLIRSKRFREWYGLPPLVKPASSTTTPIAHSTPTLNVVGTYKPPTAQGVLEAAPGPLGKLKQKIGNEVKGEWKGFKKGLYEKMGKEDPDAAGYKKPTRSKEFVKNANDYERMRRREIRADKEF